MSFLSANRKETGSAHDLGVWEGFGSSPDVQFLALFQVVFFTSSLL